MKKGWTYYDLVDLSDSLCSFLVDYAEHETISTLTANANQLLMAIRQIDSNEQHANQEVEEPAPSTLRTPSTLDITKDEWFKVFNAEYNTRYEDAMKDEPLGAERTRRAQVASSESKKIANVARLRAVWMSTHDCQGRADAYYEYMMAQFALKEEGIS
jgi:hypothetical protein